MVSFCLKDLPSFSRILRQHESGVKLPEEGQAKNPVRVRPTEVLHHAGLELSFLRCTLLPLMPGHKDEHSGDDAGEWLA